MVLEGLYKSKLQDSFQHRTVLALYDQETVRNGRHPSCKRLKTSVRLHTDQMMRTHRRSKVIGLPFLHASQSKDDGLRWKASGSAISGQQKDNVRKETHVVSTMDQQRLLTDARLPRTNARWHACRPVIRKALRWTRETFSGDGKEFTKVSRAVTEAKSY